MTKVLIIEDEPLARKLLAKLLGRHGYEVLSATNGLDGLKMVARHRPALVITDVIMPGIDGTRVCAELREHFPDTAILAVSGSDAGVVDALALGADRMLMKPFHLEELLETLGAMHAARHHSLACN